MIANIENIKDPLLVALIHLGWAGTLKGLQLLDASGLEIHPCGSRFFGDATPESDFDFFTEDSPEARQALVDVGFEDRTFDYPDHNSVSVLGMGEVHVITVKSVSARLKAQQYIIENKLERPKRDSEWWCRLYEELRDKGLIEAWWDKDVDEWNREPSKEEEPVTI